MRTKFLNPYRPNTLNMVNLPKIEEFAKEVNENREKTGSVKETVLGGELEIRMSLHETPDDHRAGSFSLLIKTDRDIEELAHEEILALRDLDSKYEPYEKELNNLIDENFGYNPYEPIMDKASQPGEEDFDIVFHDSVIVFD